ncbi:unnamed protein product [Nippostrongylus brasiliensis]|uniref:Transmembrane protein n=1 Tax=Nippostrongylus brasiliensis TaxID=27835 RepID=A0A158R1H1_NIPBR|nr:unnamed protein product [Nippostrongylus brasiliensis]
MQSNRHSHTNTVIYSGDSISKIEERSLQYEPLLGMDTSIYANVALLALYCLAIPVNVFFVVAVLPELSRKCLMKVKLLITAMIVVNVIWSFNWLWMTLAATLIEDSDEVMLVLNADDDGAYLRETIWELVAHQLVDNLLSTYTTTVENVMVKLILVLLPFALSATVFDHRVLSLVLSTESAVFCRLCLLICPSLVSMTLLLVAMFPMDAKAGFEPRSPMSMSTALPNFMLFVVILDVFWRAAFFFQLLEVDFDFRIVTGSEIGDTALQTTLDIFFEVGVFIVHLFALYFPVGLMIFVQHYKILASSRLSQLSAVFCCRSDSVVNYRCETMRSILADQKKRRDMMMSVH